MRIIPRSEIAMERSRTEGKRKRNEIVALYRVSTWSRSINLDTAVLTFPSFPPRWGYNDLDWSVPLHGVVLINLLTPTFPLARENYGVRGPTSPLSNQIASNMQGATTYSPFPFVGIPWHWRLRMNALTLHMHTDTLSLALSRLFITCYGNLSVLSRSFPDNRLNIASGTRTCPGRSKSVNTRSPSDMYCSRSVRFIRSE